MADDDPIGLLFGGLEKLGPGSDSDTIEVLRCLPNDDFELIVDVGCGAGRQTLALAGELQTLVHAVDNHQPFLNTLMENAKEKSLQPWSRLIAWT